MEDFKFLFYGLLIDFSVYAVSHRAVFATRNRALFVLRIKQRNLASKPALNIGKKFYSWLRKRLCANAALVNCFSFIKLCKRLSKKDLPVQCELKICRFRQKDRSFCDFMYVNYDLGEMTVSEVCMGRT